MVMLSLEKAINRGESLGPKGNVRWVVTSATAIRRGAINYVDYARRTTQEAEASAGFTLSIPHTEVGT